MEASEAKGLRRLEEENRRLSEHLRSTQRCELRAEDHPAMRERLVALADQRPRFGYPCLHILLRHEGFPVNRKCAAPGKGRPMIPAFGAHVCWSMGFVSVRFGDGRQFLTPNDVDDSLKRCPVPEVDTSISSERVTHALAGAIEAHGTPLRLVMDNGPEFTSLLAWAVRGGIELVWIDPGKPIQNAYMESFNARPRDVPEPTPLPEPERCPCPDRVLMAGLQPAQAAHVARRREGRALLRAMVGGWLATRALSVSVDLPFPQ
jgi:putative transposase